MAEIKSKIQVTELPPLDDPQTDEARPSIGQGIIPKAKPRPHKPSPQRSTVLEAMANDNTVSRQHQATRQFIQQVIEHPSSKDIWLALDLIKDLNLPDSAARMLLPGSDIQALLELATTQVLVPMLYDSSRTSEAQQLMPLRQEQALTALKTLSDFVDGLPSPLATALIEKNLTNIKRIIAADYGNASPTKNEIKYWQIITKAGIENAYDAEILPLLIRNWQSRQGTESDSRPELDLSFHGLTSPTAAWIGESHPELTNKGLWGKGASFVIWGLNENTNLTPDAVVGSHAVPCPAFIPQKLTCSTLVSMDGIPFVDDGASEPGFGVTLPLSTKSGTKMIAYLHLRSEVYRDMAEGKTGITSFHSGFGVSMTDHILNRYFGGNNTPLAMAVKGLLGPKLNIWAGADWRLEGMLDNGELFVRVNHQKIHIESFLEKMADEYLTKLDQHNGLLPSALAGMSNTARGLGLNLAADKLLQWADDVSSLAPELSEPETLMWLKQSNTNNDA